ncbi:MAG: hypothetical protein JWN78_2908 [Bacteroidota bacterium]|nr:hypothetical protein [Bacteroidota bacterium]
MEQLEIEIQKHMIVLDNSSVLFQTLWCDKQWKKLNQIRNRFLQAYDLGNN